jgi:hypothetical protein
MVGLSQLLPLSTSCRLMSQPSQQRQGQGRQHQQKAAGQAVPNPKAPTFGRQSNDSQLLSGNLLEEGPGVDQRVGQHEHQHQHQHQDDGLDDGDCRRLGPRLMQEKNACLGTCARRILLPRIVDAPPVRVLPAVWGLSMPIITSSRSRVGFH